MCDIVSYIALARTQAQGGGYVATWYDSRYYSLANRSLSIWLEVIMECGSELLGKATYLQQNYIPHASANSIHHLGCSSIFHAC